MLLLPCPEPWCFESVGILIDRQFFTFAMALPLAVQITVIGFPSQGMKMMVFVAPNDPDKQLRGSASGMRR